MALESIRTLASASVLLFALTGFGCRLGRPSGGPEAEPEPVELREPVRPPPVVRRSPAESGSNPRAAAASALVEEGRQLFRSGQTDAALGRFERAASMSPRSGPAHYWLAEAWRARGDAAQAREHHRLAKRYLSGLPDWSARLETQAAALR